MAMERREGNTRGKEGAWLGGGGYTTCSDMMAQSQSLLLAEKMVFTNVWGMIMYGEIWKCI